MAIKRPEGEVSRVGRVVACDFGDRKGVVAVLGGLNVSLDEKLWTDVESLRPKNFKSAEVDLHFRVTRGQGYYDNNRYDYLLLGTKKVKTKDLRGVPTVGYEVFDMKREKLEE